MKRFACCPLCGEAKLEYVFAVDEQGVERCRSCSLVLLNPQPDADDARLYSEGYYRGQCDLKQRGEENVLDPARIQRRLESCAGIVETIERALGRKGRWLDLGCGPGFLLKVAHDAGWEVAGADVSEFATRYAREVFGVRELRTGPLEQVDFPDGAFDVVTLQHVIEHFRDPVRMVHRIQGWLRADGLLWLETPDVDSGRARRAKADWDHLKVPEHLFYFNERTLKRLLRRARLEVVSVHRPVAGTGLLEAACGGHEEARRFYDRVRDNPIFQTAIRGVRYANELYQARVRGASDVVQVLARKTPSLAVR